MEGRAIVAVGVVALLAGCAGGPPAAEDETTAPLAPLAPSTPPAQETTAPIPTPEPTPTATPEPSPSPEVTLPPGVTPPPDWLGTRVLPERPDGFGEVRPTPPELVDRRFTTDDALPPPPEDDFHAEVSPAPDDVLARSTWSRGCPVTREELAYVTVTFWGFDHQPHTGELLVNAAVAEDLVEVFRRLHEARFPIEEMRITRAAELDAPRTGDGNNTTAFVCRPTVGATSWSQHAYGLAIDVNPFHNPYVRGEVVLPELASAYLDRSRDLPGMIHAGDVVTQAFADIGWGWGGDFTTLKDWMHFSASGR